MFPLQTVLEPTRSHSKEIKIVAPSVEHGGDIWRVAKDSVTLDLNSSYMYMLFARDFADSCRVTLVDGEVAAFVLAYRRVEDPECLFVWQIAVDESFRGRGIARRMLDDLIDDSKLGDSPIRSIETTITDDNAASKKLFGSLADRWDTTMKTRDLFAEQDFPDPHDPERLHMIGPIDPHSRD